MTTCAEVIALEHHLSTHCAQLEGGGLRIAWCDPRLQHVLWLKLRCGPASIAAIEVIPPFSWSRG